MSRLNELETEMQAILDKFQSQHQRYDHLNMIAAQLQDPQASASVLKTMKLGVVLPEPLGLVETPCTDGAAVALHAVTESANNLVRGYPALFRRLAELATEAEAHCATAVQKAEAAQAQQPVPPLPAAPAADAPPAPRQLQTSAVTPLQQ